MKIKWVITCEHGGNDIPPAFAALFTNKEKVLKSHRGFDPGAYELYQLLASNLADFSHFSLTSRLLVELNRSLHHKNLFSDYTKPLPEGTKKEILAKYYFPYRKLIEDKIRQYQSQGFKVHHLSIHSFCPELDGEVRNADIGLLYDPGRQEEKAFCSSWRNQLKSALSEARVRMNYPYQGKSDGFTTFLRRQFTTSYHGIELEVNQQHAQSTVIREGILHSLKELKEG